MMIQPIIVVVRTDWIMHFRRTARFILPFRQAMMKTARQAMALDSVGVAAPV